jgi:hypothetical protein
MVQIDNKSLRNNLWIEKGIVSGCPFCKALNADLPNIGDKVRVLSDFMAGLIGEVVKLRPNEIIVHFFHDPPGYEYRIFTKYNLVEPSTFSPVPSWAPSILLRHAAEIHSHLINICNECLYDGKCKFKITNLLVLIVYIWRKRLPIEATELWSIFEAHGLPSRWKNRLILLYKNCDDVLRIYHFMDTGRNYRKIKKVSPFSS